MLWKPLGLLFPSALLEQHSNPGGGESTPPPVPPVWHFFITGGTQSGAPNISYVLARVIEEATEVSCCEYRGTYEQDFISVWDAADGTELIEVLGTHFFVI